MNNDEIGRRVDLNTDSCCDTCGGQDQALAWSLSDAGAIEIRAAVACYDSDELTTTDLDKALAFVAEVASWYPEHDTEFQSEAEAIREALTPR